MAGRTYAIGDVHGALKCLVELLEKLPSLGDGDTLVLLGDYVDGYPESAGVLDLVGRLMEPGGAKVVALKGNHDEWAREWLAVNPDGRPDSLHFDQGGRATVESYSVYGGGKEEREAKTRHLRLLNSLPSYHLDEDGRLFVHGGYERGHLDHERVLYWDRSLMRDAYRMHLTREGAERVDGVEMGLPARYAQYPAIFVGHTATKYFTDKEEPAVWLNVHCLDTNCGWGGPLCAMDVESGEVWLSKPAREYYPDHLPRG